MVSLGYFNLLFSARSTKIDGFTTIVVKSTQAMDYSKTSGDEESVLLKLCTLS